MAVIALLFFEWSFLIERLDDLFFTRYLVNGLMRNHRRNHFDYSNIPWLDFN